MKFFDKKSMLWNFFKKFANLNFSIFILLLITFFSMLGSIIEQDQNLSYYKTYYPINSMSLSIINWKWIYYLGLDHIYRTWWFMTILFFFMLTLIICTFSTQLPSFKNARRWKFVFYTKSKNKKNEYFFIDKNIFYRNSLTNVIYPLIFCNFFVFHKKHSIYAYKGLYGRIAPIFVHFGIIITFLGFMVSFLSGFVSQEMIPTGEIFHIKNLVHAGFYSKLPIDLYGRIESFHISYNIDNSIKQFFSKISLFYHSKQVIKSKLISVNSPLILKNITLYQTDWQINALRIQLGFDTILQKHLVKTNINSNECWLCNLPIEKNKHVFFILFSLNNTISIYNTSGVFITKVSINENFYINNVFCSIQNVIISTGLQVKVDLGIYIVYSGFFIVMLSTFLSYLSYSQIWIYMTLSTLKFMGSTNRAILLLEEDVNIINFYYNYFINNDYINFNNIFNKILK
uniref:Cytochrome c biogenesis protein Ccs1 n=1 Tax=Bostrychia simpliciuscula TaxID=324754 RepID=A0A1Z1M851_9FLOR|nr:cytochrome c biogenesis protein ccs1 [Bostrychia simpliciuscula]ARW62011.1 cytochrome c biogenesis protein ccs1 [Bostrychia simpliciuscula]